MEGVQMSEYTIPTSNTVTTIDPQATKIRELQERITQLEQENDSLRADLLLWNEKEVKP
jgi:cell shape-determining protein MreC